MPPRRQRLLNNKWDVISELQAGGQGTVWLVRETQTSRKYAAKIFRVKGYETKKLERAKTEVASIKKLQGSTNVVQIYDENISDATSGSPVEIYYIMDLARFGSLADNDFYIGDIELCLRLFKQILIGVLRAHEKGVIHRDLKPANILLYPTQRDIVITDFGLGLIKDRDPDEGVTEADEVLGARFFMAPEQYRDPSNATERSDIYSLGKILYFMLTGKGKVYREKLDDLNESLQPANPYIPQIQEKLLARMVAESPTSRFNSVNEIIDEVDRISEQVNLNSRRYVEAGTQQGLDFYDVLIGRRREEFINSFKASLPQALYHLEMAGSELIKGDRQYTLSSLVADLFAKYKGGKIRVGINAVLAYIDDPSALAKMQDTSRYSLPSYYMARYYLRSLSYDTAHAYIVDALGNENDTALRLSYLLVFEEVSRKCSCAMMHDYDEQIKALLREAPESQKAGLLQTLGTHYLGRGNKKKGLRFLDAFLQIKPYDHDVRWKTAYEYGTLGEAALAIHHYGIYLTHNPEAVEAMNNLAVAYEGKQLMIESLEMYQRSHQLGHTLAGANIASRYLRVGMIKDATKLLNEIIVSSYPSEYHESVAAQLGNIVNVKKREEKDLGNIRTQGEELAHHNVQAIRSLISTSQFSWIGKWELGTAVFECRQDGPINRIAVANVVLAEFDGRIDGSCLEVERYQTLYAKEYTDGLFYLVDEDNFSGYLLTADDYKIVHGARKRD
jgi:serine/threonine protein kinase